MHTSIRLASSGAVLLGMGLFINWLGCGGTPSPNLPTGDTSSVANTSPSTTSTPDMPSSTGTSTSTADTSTATTPTATTPPPPPTFGSSDCYTCVTTKACAKQADACSKDTECKVVMDAVAACTAMDMKGVQDCAKNATQPTKKPGKAANAAMSKCAGGAGDAKKGACKDTCK
jgi:hypothetical protein